MAPRPTRPGSQRKVAVEVEEDRAREVPGVIGPPTRPRLPEHPADVHDADTRPVDPPGERLGRDQRPTERPTHRRLNVRRR